MVCDPGPPSVRAGVGAACGRSIQDERCRRHRERALPLMVSGAPLRCMRRIRSCPKQGGDLAACSCRIRFGQNLLFILARISTPLCVGPKPPGFGRGASRPPGRKITLRSTITLGADIRLIQDCLGHRNIPHTVRYTAINPALLENL